MIKEATFVERFNETLTKLKLSQQDISDISGISKSLISRYANGKLCPKVDTIGCLAKALGINPVWLIGYACPMIVDDEKEKVRKMIKRKIDMLNYDEIDKLDNLLSILFPHIVDEEEKKTSQNNN